MSVRVSRRGLAIKMRHLDISRAHFMPLVQRDIYIELPQEDVVRYGKDKVGKLLRSMYGTQDAANLWQWDYVELTIDKPDCYTRGKHNPAVF